MWKKEEFISNSLPKFRGRLTDAANHVLNAQLPTNTDSTANNEKTAELAKKAVLDESFKKALEKRREEFKKVRRDVISRLTESIAKLPEDISNHKNMVEEIDKSQASFDEMLNKLNSLDDSKWNQGNFSAELGDAMKMVENTRLEYLSISAKLEKIRGTTSGTVESAKYDSFILELMSLSFKQVFTLGLYFFLPLIIAIAATGFLLVLGMIAAMKL